MHYLSNPYLTNQTRQDLIAEEVDKEYLNEKIEQAARGNQFGSSSYWIVSVSDLIKMNDASCKTDSHFNFYNELLEELNPDFDILLLEHDNVLKGEYDTYRRRWSTYSYINVCAVAVNGYFKTIPFDDRDDVVVNYDFEGSELYKANRDVLHKDRDGIWGLGVIDIPKDVLDEYEDNRVYRRTYAFSKMFEQGMENVFLKAKNKARNRTRKLSINRRKKGGFGK